MPSSEIPPEHSKVTDPAALPSHAVYQPPFYYQFAINILKPLYRLQVWRRSHKRDNYQQEVAQRFGKQYPPRPMVKETNADNATTKATPSKGVVWCHAVSLGETNTVAPLLDALLAEGYQIWLTNTTQTGFTRGANRFADEIAQGRMSHSYVPVDSPRVIENFLAHVQPIAALFVETELWANILTKLSEHRIPSILVNGRLSASSFQSYQKIAAVSASMVQNLTLIIAQDNASAKRFRQLGANSAQIRVAGSLKWVINTPKRDDKTDSTTHHKASEDKGIEALEWIKQIESANRPIWVAASTHSGEEAAALSLHKQLLADAAFSDVLLIIVPRHPERFDEVAALIQESAFSLARRSANDVMTANTQVYLADSMGELMTWYKLADVALVGGSLVDVGGHNPVEPASVATPVLMGRYTQSCQTVVDKLSEVGALYQPNNTFYTPINSSAATDVASDVNEQLSIKKTQPALALDDNSGNDKSRANTNDSDDIALIYQQLASWLHHLELAEIAGQAGEQMTVQQQAVLTRQLTMIEDVIVNSL